ncbi:bifunctional hydroxymethylpyrimidine kinase/phosphomethylpyrimidine kinase [Haloferula sp.]|uniref:bifunctional hydroxymethylpyrimidine kinase/phosphomethylpyrimidine kinase n=1 Tax=Haloferula sp. TaxID=2497595 RepID=UPI003C71FF61
MIPIALTIAGSDCSAGAGLQADLKTFQHFRSYGLTAATCVVAETPTTVLSIHPVPPAILQDQVKLLLDSYPIAAIKTGMLFSKAHVVAVSEIISKHPTIPLVVDPVMVASSGESLLKKDAVEAYIDRLLPLATLITPNLDEAEVLIGHPVRDEDAIEKAARALSLLFKTSILLKGGHLNTPECADLLDQQDTFKWFRSPRIDTPASHGTGCTLSAAIAARLAHGDDLATAVGHAKSYLSRTLSEALTLGKLNHLNQGTSFTHSTRDPQASLDS